MNAQQLLEQIVADLEKLAASYDKAGLFSASQASSRVTQLVGGHEEVLALRRALLLVSGLLRNVVGRQLLAASAPPRHVSIFGGTQVGKSTIMNVLAASASARVHHTAGYTRHAQAFVPSALEDIDLFGENPESFKGFTRVTPEELDPQRPDIYSVQLLANSPPLSTAVLWDAPDCDAVDWGFYQRALVETVTLADVVVYVTSKEKYAVNSILEWVLLLLEAQIPVIGVLNMTPRAQQADILRSMREALSKVAARQESKPSNTAPGELPKAPLEDIIAFEYVPDGDVSLLYGYDYQPSLELRRQVQLHLDDLAQNPQSRPHAALDFSRKYLPAILSPALTELEAARQWDQEIDLALERFLEDYEKRYLNDPQRYDAFNRVGLEILALLNPPIPGLQETLAYVRKILSLPARLILGAVRMLWNLAFSGGQSHAGAKVSAELQTYQEAHEQLLSSLARSIARHRTKSLHHPFWDALDGLWEGRVKEIQSEFHTQLEAHRQRSEQWIRETAQAIYNELAKDPVRLNFLRTSRIAADAAAIVVSIKTGGHGDILHDIIVAPALMTLVEAVTQQLTDSYVQVRRQELRQKLLEDTRSFVLELYGKRLQTLGRQALEEAGFLELKAEQITSLPARLELLSRMMGYPSQTRELPS